MRRMVLGLRELGWGVKTVKRQYAVDRVEAGWGRVRKELGF